MRSPTLGKTWLFFRSCCDWLFGPRQKTQPVAFPSDSSDLQNALEASDQPVADGKTFTYWNGTLRKKHWRVFDVDQNRELPPPTTYESFNIQTALDEWYQAVANGSPFSYWNPTKSADYWLLSDANRHYALPCSLAFNSEYYDYKDQYAGTNSDSMERLARVNVKADGSWTLLEKGVIRLKRGKS